MNLTQKQRKVLHELDVAGKKIEKLLKEENAGDGYFPDPISFTDFTESKKSAAGRQNEVRKALFEKYSRKTES